MSSSQIPTDLSYGGGHTGHTRDSIISTSAASVSALSPISILTPTSASTLYASPDSANQPFFGAKSEPDDGDGASSGGSVTAAGSAYEPVKKKQKRNKPTLSCYECVERKTKASASRFRFRFSFRFRHDIIFSPRLQTHMQTRTYFSRLPVLLLFTSSQR